MFESFFFSLKSNEFEAILCTSYKEVPFESLVASVQSILRENVNLCHLSCSQPSTKAWSELGTTKAISTDVTISQDFCAIASLL